MLSQLIRLKVPDTQAVTYFSFKKNIDTFLKILTQEYIFIDFREEEKERRRNIEVREKHH